MHAFSLMLIMGIPNPVVYNILERTYSMGGGLELGIVSMDIIVSCQRCSYSSGGVITVSLSLKIFFDCFISSLD